MTDPFDDFERRIADDLHAWTDGAPRKADFADEARLVTETPARRRRWPVLVLAMGTVVAAAVLTIAVLDLGPFSAPPSAVGSPSPASSGVPSPAPTADAPSSASPSASAAEEIDLAHLAWYDATDVAFGYIEAPAPGASPLPDPYTRLRVGTLDGHVAAELDLLDGARASGPFGTYVLVIQDDGTASTLSLVSALDGSERSLLALPEMVVTATLSPDRAFVYYIAVDRATGVDDGLWRWSIAEERSEPVAEGQIAETPHDFAVSWQMAWSPDGGYLVTQACRMLICRELVHRPSDGFSRRADDSHAELIGATDTDYVVHDFRSGPAVTAIDLASGASRVVAESDGVSWLVTSDQGTYIVVEPSNEFDLRAYRLDAISLDDGHRRTLVSRPGTDPTGATVYRTGDRAASGVVVPEGWILRWPAPEGLPFMDAGVAPHEWYAGELINVATGKSLRVPPTIVATGYPDCAPVAPAELPSGASTGEPIETIGGYYRWATWGSDADQVVQVVGAWLYAAQPTLDSVVTVRGQAGRFVAITSEGPFAIAWEEAGCRYEIQLAPGITHDDALDYAERY